MVRKTSARWLALLLAMAMLFGLMPAMAFADGEAVDSAAEAGSETTDVGTDEAGVADYASFLAELKVLEGYADAYAAANTKHNASELVLNFIRTGVERYNDGNWVTLAGEEITDFTAYVEAQDAANGTTAMRLRNIIIENFYLPNGNQTDFGHMFGTMNISWLASRSADLAGWAGDLCDLILFSRDYGNVPAGTVEEMAAFILENCFGVDADDAFGMDDFYGDMDAYYLIAQMKAGTALSAAMEAYFTAELNDGQRSAYFLNNRFGGLETREDVRAAIYDTYSADVGIQVLEADRGLSEETDMRTASCYALADYMFNKGGHLLDPDAGSGDDNSGDDNTGDDTGDDNTGDDTGDEEITNPYYDIFSSTESVLAPGITQTINYATTADDKQIVYYVATVDVTRDDVTIMANYKDNDPSAGWGMQRVEDQAAALLAKHTDPDDAENYIENFNVIVATNADGYNMSTGEPGGLLVMEGREWHAIDGDGFFAIMKDGSAMIGTKADYEANKAQVQEGIGAFGAVLIRDGEVAINKSSDYYTSRASRTAIGITAEGKVVMMVLDGRQEPFSAGGSMEEIAQIMLEAGCVEAVNLDGGGSTTYLSKPEGSDSLRLINRPSDGYARSVSTSLAAVSTAKSSKEFDHANISSEYDYLTVGTSLTMSATGVSNTGSAASIPEGAVWQLSDDSIGSINADGVFTAAANGDVDVQLAVDGTVVGSKTLHVVVPDEVKFVKETMNVVCGTPTELPISVLYDGQQVAYNEYEVILFTEHEEAGTFEGLYFTANEDCGIRVETVYVAVFTEESYFIDTMTVNLYGSDEAVFDFDNATAGTRQLAWTREVSNAETYDNYTYYVTEPGLPMDVAYTFALDMTQIDVPSQLADLTYMLPGADTGATAWDFLLQLAERVSEHTEVKVTAQFDPDFEIDYSELSVHNDFFRLESAAMDEETNTLTIVCTWIDRTQAVDPTTANPICILSGLKAVPKEGAAWDENEKLDIINEGDVSYRIYLRASSLYSFAQSPSNQAKYGLTPFSSEIYTYNGGPEQGAWFGTTYATFEDAFVLDGAERQGWYSFDDQLYYYVDHVALTGIQKVPSHEDASQQLFYNFGETGACQGTVTGLIEIDGKFYYAMAGVQKFGWQSAMDENGDSWYYYFDPYTGAAVDGECKVEGYNYVFDNCRCVRGELVWTDAGYKYRFAGMWQRNQWVEWEGKMYYIERNYYALGEGFHWIRDVEGSDGNKCHLFDENCVWMEDYSGLFHDGDDTYLIDRGIRIQEPGLVYIDGYYYYFAANAKAVKNRTYWPTKTNGLLPMGPYDFDEYGHITNLPATEEPDVPVEPDTPETPDIPEVVKDGIVCENGGYFYYKNGVLQYSAGLILIDGDYYYIRSNGQAAVGNYWVTNDNGLLPAGMYTFGSDGKMIVDGSEPEEPSEPDTPVEVKNGVVNENGVLYYYIDGVRAYCAGIVKLTDDEGVDYYIYVRSNAQLATGKYWPTNTNDLLPQGLYDFGADGRYYPPTASEPDDGEDGGETETPEVPTVKNGIVEENGVLYYYIDGTRAYGAGVLLLTDESGASFYIYVRSNAQLATGIYWPTTTNGLLNHQAYDWGTDGRLYL